MVDWRSIKEKGRRAVHATMKVAAFYKAPGQDALVPCTVRVHDSFKALGDMAGTSYDYAEIEEKTPEIVFWLEDGILPARNGLVILSFTEGYSLGAIKPVENLTQTANAAPIEPEEAAFYFASRPGQ